MIKITHVAPAGHHQLALTFSDGSSAIWSAEALIARQTELTKPLENQSYFARAFIEAGALAWPNGFELSPAALHQRLAAEGKITRTAA